MNKIIKKILLEGNVKTYLSENGNKIISHRNFSIIVKNDYIFSKQEDDIIIMSILLPVEMIYCNIKTSINEQIIDGINYISLQGNELEISLYKLSIYINDNEIEIYDKSGRLILMVTSISNLKDYID